MWYIAAIVQEFRDDISADRFYPALGACVAFIRTALHVAL